MRNHLMKVLLRKALPEDFQEIVFVHYKAWLETYHGLLPKSFLDKRSLESSITIFKNNHCANTVVAIADDKQLDFVVGVVCEKILFKRIWEKFKEFICLTPIKKIKSEEK